MQRHQRKAPLDSQQMQRPGKGGVPGNAEENKYMLGKENPADHLTKHGK